MRARKGSGSFLNGRSREKWRSKRQKQNNGIAKAGCHPKRVAPRFFAFIWISSFSVALLAWKSVCASPHCENRRFRNGQRKQIIRTHLLSETSSDYIGLVPAVGLEPTRCCHQRILSYSSHSEPNGLNRNKTVFSVTFQNIKNPKKPYKISIFDAKHQKYKQFVPSSIIGSQIPNLRRWRDVGGM